MNHAVEIGDGVSMPLLGFGTWQATGRAAYAAVRRALEVGYRHIDTATAYGNEKEVGRALADAGLARGDVFVTTKMPPGRAGHERSTLEESLGDLGCDQVDLWLVHWPPSSRAFSSVWERFVESADAGLARAIGVSNYSLGQIDELGRATGRLPAVNQIEWSPRLFDSALLEGHRRRGVQLEGYSPLKASNLADPRLVKIAAAHRVTPAQVVIRWHVEHEIVVIPKSIDPDRIAENADVFGFTLSDDEMVELDRLSAAR